MSEHGLIDALGARWSGQARGSPSTRRSLAFPVALARALALALAPALALIPAKVSAAGTDERPALPALTSIRDVRNLTPDEAARGRRVDVTTVVTFVNFERGVLFVQDATAGIFIDASGSSPRPELRRGLAVHVSGQSAAGGFNPIVRAERIEPGGAGPLAPPLRANLAAVTSGAVDCEWVEVEGIVRATPTVSGLRGLKLAVDDGILHCWIKDTTAWPWDELTGAVVRVRGVCAGALGERAELFGFDLFATDATDLTLVRPAPFGESDVVNRTINELLLDLQKGGAGRARTRGHVTLHWPGRFLFIQDATGAVELRAGQLDEGLAPGDEVEAMGFPSLRNRRVVLEDCRILKLAGGAPPSPARRAGELLLTEHNQGQLVTVQATLVKRSQHARIRASGLAPTTVETVPLLVLATSNLTFRAELPPEFSPAMLSQLQPGSELSLTGVCIAEPVEEDLARTYRLLVGHPGAISVIRNPPWWTSPRFYKTAGAAVLATLSIMGWVIGFTQRRRRQAERAMKLRSEETIRLQDALLKLAAATDSSFPAAVSRVTESVAHAVQVERVSVWELQDPPGELRCVELYLRSAHQHAAAPTLDAARFPRYFAALRESRTLAADDARSDLRTAEFTDAYLIPLDIHSMLDVPIRWRGHLAGVLCLEQTARQRAWTVEELSFAAGAADRLSIHLEERERLRAEAALRRSEEKFARAFGSSPDAIVITRLRDGTVIEANEGCSRIYGFPKDELVGIKSSETVWPPGDRAHLLALIERQGYAREFEAWQRRKNGERFPAQISSETIEIDGERCLVSVVRDLTERKRAEADRQRLLAQLLSAEDEERGRIARELHDTTAQHLAAVTMNLTRLLHERPGLSPPAWRLADESLQLAGLAVQEIRTLTYLLHPPMLEELGLVGALRDYTAGFAKRCGLQVSLDVDDFSGRLRRDIELALFRVVQESLVNAHRHSGSATATVRLGREDHEVRVEIQDNGCGLPAPTAGSLAGVGIAGMRERLRQLGGGLEVESDASGVTVLASLPLSTQSSPDSVPTPAPRGSSAAEVSP